MILDYLARHGIHMYRMSSDLALYATHPDLRQFHDMVRESAAELAAIGAKARSLDIRLSFPPSQYVLINSPDPALTAKSVCNLASQAEMLDLMELGPEAVVVTHVGGAYGDRQESAARWARTSETLPEPVRRRLVLEHDDVRFSAADTLWIHAQTGAPLVFDHQHSWCLNPQALALRDTLARMLTTWPCGVRPKVHFSSPKTDFRQVKREDSRSGKATTADLPPVWTGHANQSPKVLRATASCCDSALAADLEKDFIKMPAIRGAGSARMEETLIRTACLEPVDGKIVWLRAYGTRWKTICWTVGLQRSAAHQHWLFGLALGSVEVQRNGRAAGPLDAGDLAASLGAGLTDARPPPGCSSARR